MRDKEDIMFRVRDRQNVKVGGDTYEAARTNHLLELLIEVHTDIRDYLINSNPHAEGTKSPNN